MKYLISIIEGKSYFLLKSQIREYPGKLNMCRTTLIFVLKSILNSLGKDIMMDVERPPKKSFIVNMLYNVSPNYFIFLPDGEVTENLMEKGIELLPLI